MGHASVNDILERNRLNIKWMQLWRQIIGLFDSFARHTAYDLVVLFLTYLYTTSAFLGRGRRLVKIVHYTVLRMWLLLSKQPPTIPGYRRVGNVGILLATASAAAAAATASPTRRNHDGNSMVSGVWFRRVVVMIPSSCWKLDGIMNLLSKLSWGQQSPTPRS